MKPSRQCCGIEQEGMGHNKVCSKTGITTASLIKSGNIYEKALHFKVFPVFISLDHLNDLTTSNIVSAATNKQTSSI